MTKEEKQLLVKDLCARLPYGVNAYAFEINKKGVITSINIAYNIVNLTTDNSSGSYELVPVEDIKPYLRPMSSMTKEEKEEYTSYCFEQPFLQKDKIPNFGSVPMCIDWLIANHFDYRGLIPMGLALEAEEGMYKLNKYKRLLLSFTILN